MARTYGDEVQGKSNFPLGNIGDFLEGTYLGLSADRDEYGRLLHRFLIDSGDEIELRGCYDLDGKLSQFASGTVMRIERKADKPTNAGTMKIFKVQPALDDNGAPIVEVAKIQGEPQSLSPENKSAKLPF